MAELSLALPEIFDDEGHYSNELADSGGATAWGVQETEARAYGYKGDMRAFTKSDAEPIIKAEYWDKINCDKINNQILANLLLNIGYNQGLASPVLSLQRFINLKSSGVQLILDGTIGGVTLSAINALNDNDTLQACLSINSMAVYRWENIVANNPTQKVFLTGWLNRGGLNFIRILKGFQKI